MAPSPARTPGPRGPGDDGSVGHADEPGDPGADHEFEGESGARHRATGIPATRPRDGGRLVRPGRRRIGGGYGRPPAGEKQRQAADGLLLSTAAGGGSGPNGIGVVLKGLDNPFFVALYEGARAEAGRRHVVASFRAATNVDDAAGQAARARRLVQGGTHACYVVNPISGTKLVPAFRGVKRPIVNVDSPIDRVAARRAGMRIETYIGTDDPAAGGLAATAMVSALGERGEVALVGGYAVGSTLRLRGFTRGVEGTRIKIVARANAGYDRARAQLAARRILRSHPRVAGFFAANDVMALGIADAVQAVGKRGAVEVISMDAIPAALDAVRASVLHRHSRTVSVRDGADGHRSVHRGSARQEVAAEG